MAPRAQTTSSFVAMLVTFFSALLTGCTIDCEPVGPRLQEKPYEIKYGYLKGVFVYEGGEPAADITVKLIAYGNTGLLGGPSPRTERARTQTNELGEFDFGKVKIGRYGLSAPGIYGDYSVSIYENRITTIHYTIRSIVPDGEPPGVSGSVP